jgi:hypothetical protein
MFNWVDDTSYKDSYVVYVTACLMLSCCAALPSAYTHNSQNWEDSYSPCIYWKLLNHSLKYKKGSTWYPNYKQPYSHHVKSVITFLYWSTCKCPNVGPKNGPVHKYTNPIYPHAHFLLLYIDRAILGSRNPKLGTCPSYIPLPFVWNTHYLQHSHFNRYIPSLPTISASTWTVIGHPEDEGTTFHQNVWNTYYMAQKTNCFKIGVKPSTHTYLSHTPLHFPSISGRKGVSGGTVGWGAVLETGRSRVRCPMV